MPEVHQRPSRRREQAAMPSKGLFGARQAITANRRATAPAADRQPGSRQCRRFPTATKYSQPAAPARIPGRRIAAAPPPLRAQPTRLGAAELVSQEPGTTREQARFACFPRKNQPQTEHKKHYRTLGTMHQFGIDRLGQWPSQQSPHRCTTRSVMPAIRPSAAPRPRLPERRPSGGTCRSGRRAACPAAWPSSSRSDLSRYSFTRMAI